MWIDITTVEQSGRFEVQMHTDTGAVRHRTRIPTVSGAAVCIPTMWQDGEPPPVRPER